MFGLALPRLYLYAGIALAFMSVLAYAGCEHKSAAKARAERADALASLGEVVAANATNQDTIMDLQKALDAWKAIAMRSTQATERAVANAKAKESELEKLRRELKRDNTPECVEVLRTNISRACPTIDDGLRLLEAGCKDGNHTGSCTDPEAAATGAR